MGDTVVISDKVMEQLLPDPMQREAVYTPVRNRAIVVHREWGDNAKVHSLKWMYGVRSPHSKDGPTVVVHEDAIWELFTKGNLTSAKDTSWQTNDSRT